MTNYKKRSERNGKMHKNAAEANIACQWQSLSVEASHCQSILSFWISVYLVYQVLFRTSLRLKLFAHDIVGAAPLMLWLVM